MINSYWEKSTIIISILARLIVGVRCTLIGNLGQAKTARSLYYMAYSRRDTFVFVQFLLDAALFFDFCYCSGCLWFPVATRSVNAYFYRGLVSLFFNVNNGSGA